MPTKALPRPKHVPLRTCVGCGNVAAKRALIRVVSTSLGQVLPDPTGKKPGRGAYLCPNPQCWDQAVKKGRLERSLKTKLSVEDLDILHSFAHELVPHPEDAR